MINEKDEWGNISLPGLSDEDLYKTNWNRVAANKEAAQRPDVQQHNQAGQNKRKQSDWSKKMIGNTNASGNTNRLGMTNSVESNLRRSKSLMGIVRDNLRGVPKPKVTCPHCGKEGGRPQMIQYHFEKCKKRII